MEQQKMMPPSFSKTPIMPVGNDDPVTRAVVNNILGNLPTSKEKVSVHCKLCNIDFSSDIPYQMHLNGAKHAKKLKSLEILHVLQEDGNAVKTQDTNATLKCDVCGVFVNSSQQMQLHLTGAKHKAKVARKNPGNAQEISSSMPLGDDGPAAKMGKFFCETCNLSLNSEQQLQQHVTSLKHKNKVEGIVVPSKKDLWLKKKRMSKNGLGYTGGKANPQQDPDFLPPLSEAFVTGDSL